MSKTKTALSLALTAILGGIAQGQYATGTEEAVRPEALRAGKTAAAGDENLFVGDDIDAYAAAQIVAQAQEANAAKEMAAAAPAENSTASAAANENSVTAALPAPAAEQNDATNVTDDEKNAALLPVEKLSPPPEPTQIVVVEQAIYRCPKGKSYIYVDSDKRKGYNRCTLFRAEKTEEVPVGSAPQTAMPTAGGNPDSCSGTLNYKGSTYLFMEHQPCPIPDSLFRRLTPAATSR